MRLQQFLEHHGIEANPFAEEDAQSDPVFKDRCRDATHHPAWDKVYGDPADPATSIVFGEKGAGKTAMRMQIAGRIAEYNAMRSDGRLFIVEYNDFNPFLDHFADHFSARKQRDPARVLAEWKLWDHMDAVLSLAVTAVVDRALEVSHPSGSPANRFQPARLDDLDHQEKRDLLLLAACYDNSTAETTASRWVRLRRRLKYHSWLSGWEKLLGLVVTLLVAGWIIYSRDWSWLRSPWPYVAVAAGWVPWLARFWKWHLRARRITKNVRVIRQDRRSVRRLLMRFRPRDIDGQPLPVRPRTDDRYELLAKLQGVLRSLGFSGVVVLVDRVDEPHMITGSAERMRALVWSLLDNKFLKLPGLGIKLLLARELEDFIEKESRDFYQRARLDKQNLVPSLDWTGQSLYDLANARIRSCAAEGSQPAIAQMLDEAVSQQRLFDAFSGLRTPRHLFKFLHRLLVAHCNAHTDDQPVWRVPKELFEATLAVYSRDQAAIDRGIRAG